MSSLKEPGIIEPEEVTVPRLHSSTKPSTRTRKSRQEDTSDSSASIPDSQVSRVTGASLSSGAGISHDSDLVIADAMSTDEATRAHGFAGVISAICVCSAMLIPFLKGDPTARYLAVAAVCFMGLVSFWVWYITRDTTRYTKQVHLIFGFTLTTCVIFIEYYIGFYSAIGILVTLGISYFGQSSNRKYSMVIPLYVIATYMLFATLILFDLIEDRSLFPATNTEFSSRAFAVLGLAMVFGFTVWLARYNRRSMFDAIRKSNEVFLVAQRREALLAEAKNQLDNAIRLAIGKPGHHTGCKAGNYVLDVIIGIGAMGEVYGARHEETNKRSAVKILPASAMQDNQLFQRFIRESDIGLQLTHPNLVEVYEVGNLEDRTPYIAMELLEGEDLGTRLRKDTHLSLEEVVELAEDMAEGLHHAHEQGVIHRDLKPYNLFHAIGENEKRSWKILDFGISKLRDSTGTLTQGGIVGTPSYMSPEQAKNTEVDYLSDIFSMAAVLYRALTGKPAFSGQNTPQIMFDVVYRNPERPSQVKSGIPYDVDLVLAVGLAKDKTERFQSAPDFAKALRAASNRQLSSKIRTRARRILKTTPWGKLLTNDELRVIES